MPAMRPLLAVLLLAAGCGREPDPALPPAATPLQPPKNPLRNRTLPAPLERIAFAREDGLWIVNADGADLQRLVPPTCPRAAEPTWGPDRRWLAFSAALDPDTNLYPRNLFVVRPDGSDLRQVTPMARAGASDADAPRGTVRGRAVIVVQGGTRPVPNLRVTAHGQKRADATDADGNFQTYLPVGGGWIKIAGTVDERPVVGWRFTAAPEGQVTDLKDVAVNYGEDDVPSAPAWTSDGKQLVYVLRHPLDGHKAGTPRTTLRRIDTDGTGDTTLLAFSMTSILAGPVVRGDFAWCKMSEGGIVRVDLRTKAVADLKPAGISAPDALAVSPDGRTAATLAMEPTGAKSLVLIKPDGTETAATFAAGEPAPHALDFSPDGTRIVLDRHGADGKSSIWILTLATKQLSPLVEPGFSPVWHGR